MTNYGPCRLCGSDNIGTVLKAKDFEILECKICRVAFTNPPPDLPDYEKMDFHSGEDSAKAEKLTYTRDLPEDWQRLVRMQRQVIQKHFSKEAAILEIGCGEGLLLHELKEAEYTSAQGIEPSTTAANRASRKGLKVVNGYFNADLVKQQFDLVMMSHVFEHVEKPYEFLGAIKSILKPGGHIMLTQTNYTALLPVFRKEKWYAWVPEQHFWHFTPIGLKKMLRKFGLERVSINYCTLVHPKSKLYKIARLFPWMQDQFIMLAKLKK